jgi:GH24 family phage-related lysozyme (muramidase)
MSASMYPSCMSALERKAITALHNSEATTIAERPILVWLPKKERNALVMALFPVGEDFFAFKRLFAQIEQPNVCEG